MSGRRAGGGKGRDTSMAADFLPRSELLDELQWIHGIIRKDLLVCTALADAVTAGADAAYIRDVVSSLQTKGPLFQLRMTCLRYCHLVHTHHDGEDISLFPAVRAARPDLAEFVDRLESDHVRIGRLLDAVEATTALLSGQDERAARAELVGALLTLSEHLLEHLDFEERTLAPVLATWTTWPSFPG